MASAYSYLGTISLNLTTLIYCFWLIPQLFKNRHNCNSNSLSILSYTILTLGYLLDLGYGFGQHLPWQYRLVTISGLLSITINNYQLLLYKNWQGQAKNNFIISNVVLISILSYCCYQLITIHHPQLYYNICGTMSCLCWLSFVWPQLYKNYRNNNSDGVSKFSANLALGTAIGDIITAYSLSWPLTSKVSCLAILIPKMLLVLQLYRQQDR